MNAPLVSVIMPIHNAARYLPAAINSVLRQSCADWELIAVEDGSDDASLAVANRFAAQDRRIRVESMGRNTGTAAARNTAIALARGKFLAFLDADDIALPLRLAVQVRAIAHAPRGAISCSAVELIDGTDSPTGASCFDGPPECVLPTLLFRNVIANSTVLTAREGFVGFRSGYEPAEDYDAWLRAAPGATVLYSRRPLIRYRMHMSSVSARSQERMDAVRRRIVAETLSRLNAPADSEAVDFHVQIADGAFAPTLASMNRAETWLLTLRDANQASRLFCEEPFARVLTRHWHSICNGCWTIAEEAARRLSASPLAGPMLDRLLLSARLRLRGAAAKCRRKHR